MSFYRFTRAISLLALFSVMALSLIGCSIKSSAEIPVQELANTAHASTDAVLFARFVPERADDFAWENDLIAARAYGPALRDSSENAGVDCWLKRVKYPIIDKWYDLELNHGLSYHQDNGEGLDNYKVGASLGCGASALWIDSQALLLETFVSWSDLKLSTQELSFTLHYQLEYRGDIYQEQKQIRLLPAVRLFEVNSRFSKNGKPAVNLPVVLGVTTHHSNAALKYNPQKAWLSAWENIGGDELGTAVVVAAKHSVERLVAPLSSDSSDLQGVYLTHTDEQAQLKYYAGYGWSKAGEITDLGAWLNYLDRFVDNNPYSL